jgi:hypothetical protein
VVVPATGRAIGTLRAVTVSGPRQVGSHGGQAGQRRTASPRRIPPVRAHATPCLAARRHDDGGTGPAAGLDLAAHRCEAATNNPSPRGGTRVPPEPCGRRRRTAMRRRRGGMSQPSQAGLGRSGASASSVPAAGPHRQGRRRQPPPPRITGRRQQQPRPGIEAAGRGCPLGPRWAPATAPVAWLRQSRPAIAALRRPATAPCPGRG